MARKTNILFDAAGRRVELIRLFEKALRELGDEGQIFTADSSRHAPAHRLVPAARRLTIPPCRRDHEEEYVAALRDHCLRHEIALVVPTIDTSLPALAEAREDFDKAGIHIVISDPRTVRIANDKEATHGFFTRHSIPAPRRFALDELKDGDYPLFVKPAHGSSSQGTGVVHSRADVEYHLRRLARDAPKDGVPDTLIVEEFLPGADQGAEHTIDVYVDRAGRQQCAVPRRRIATRAGEVSKGVTVLDPAIIAAALDVVGKLPGPRGCITLQCFKVPDRGILFIEINPRFGGGFPLAAAAGADFPRWLIEEHRGLTPGYEAGRSFTDGLAMLRHDCSFFAPAAEVGIRR